jgi:two-component system response regulator YesN
MRAGAAATVKVSSKRLALVEDDLRTQRAMSLLHEEEGWVVEAFGDASSALDAIRAGNFQALVTDHVLPGMQGLDLVRVVRRELPAVRCVVVSGYDATKEAKAMGVAWLLKPVDFDALVQLIEAEG